MANYKKVEVMTNPQSGDVTMLIHCEAYPSASLVFTSTQFRSFAMVVMETLEDVKAIKRMHDMKGK